MIIQAIEKSKLKYKDAIPRALEDHIMARYKCSRYFAKQAVNKLITENATEKKDL
jgi:DNA-binding GntR family transcriptional regulator